MGKIDRWSEQSAYVRYRLEQSSVLREDFNSLPYPDSYRLVGMIFGGLVGMLQISRQLENLHISHYDIDECLLYIGGCIPDNRIPCGVKEKAV